jgi:hypothetical protein
MVLDLRFLHWVTRSVDSLFASSVSYDSKTFSHLHVCSFLMEDEHRSGNTLGRQGDISEPS